MHGLPFIWKIDAINRSLDSHAYLDFITKWKRIAKFSFETCEMMRSQCYKQGGRKQVRYGTKLYIQSAIKICRYSDCSHFRWACVFALCLRQPNSNFNLRPKLSLVLDLWTLQCTQTQILYLFCQWKSKTPTKVGYFLEIEEIYRKAPMAHLAQK